jgi:hypothetical protein
MASLLHIEKFPKTSDLWQAVDEQFRQGTDTVDLVMDAQIVGTILSPSAAQRALARKVAEHWLANPEMLKELAVSLDEKPEDWE